MAPVRAYEASSADRKGVLDDIFARRLAPRGPRSRRAPDRPGLSGKPASAYRIGPLESPSPTSPRSARASRPCCSCLGWRCSRAEPGRPDPQTRPDELRAATSAAAGRVGAGPDFFIVGHAKSGTTALYEMLRSHPQIFMPELQGAAVLRDRAARARFRRAREGTLRETLEEYLALFARRAPGPARRRGLVARTCGRTRPPRRIAAAAPDARIIAILREPASFLRSLHLQLAAETTSRPRTTCARRSRSRTSGAQGREIPRRSLLAAGAALLRPRPLRRAAAPLPRRASRREQVLVLIYDDFRADNEATVREVLRFLGVDDTAADRAAARPTRRCACARSGSTSSCTPSTVGRGPARAAAQERRQGA